jgi:hypothetical protein
MPYAVADPGSPPQSIRRDPPAKGQMTGRDVASGVVLPAASPASFTALAKAPVVAGSGGKLVMLQAPF